MQYSFNVEKFTSNADLTLEDRRLLDEAYKATKLAYAPYSNFLVGAAARLDNGKVIVGSNQENSSYGVALCAERTLLAHASSLYPENWINTLAISCINANKISDKPVSPCGICRQALLEHELRTKHPIRIIMGGQTGEIWIIDNARILLPLAFSNADMS